jgi:hypothetical protein
MGEKEQKDRPLEEERASEQREGGSTNCSQLQRAERAAGEANGRQLLLLHSLYRRHLQAQLQHAPNLGLFKKGNASLPFKGRGRKCSFPSKTPVKFVMVPKD